MPALIMEMLLGVVNPLVDDQQVTSGFVYSIIGWLSLLTLLFVPLGVAFAWLWWGRSVGRLKEARAESLKLSSRSSEIVEDQNTLIGKLKKSAAVYQADLSFRDNKIKKLQGDFKRIQQDLNTKIKNENHLSGVLRSRELELERIKKELIQSRDNQRTQVAELNGVIHNRDSEIRALRDDLSAKDGIYARLEELEGIIAERDDELSRLRGEFDEKSNAFAALEQNFVQVQGSREKIVSLENLLTNRDDELSRLRNDRDKLRNDLENALRNRETKIMELEDTLGERESMIVALESELESGEAHSRRIDELDNLLAARDLEIEELKANQVTKGELQNEINELTGEKTYFEEEVEKLTDLLRQRDSEIQNIKKQYHESKQQREERLHELATQFDAQNSELKSLRSMQSSVDKLKARISELEWAAGEKDAELSQLLSEKEQLENRVSEEGNLADRVRELEAALGDKSNELSGIQSAKDQLHNRVGELEKILGDRDGELNGLKGQKADLEKQLLDRDKELESLRDDRNSKDDLLSRIQELEWLLGEKEGELERIAKEVRDSEEIQSRIRDLEKMLGDRDSDVDRLNHEKVDLLTQLRIRDEDLESLRSEKGASESLIERVRDLERIMQERDSDVDRLAKEKQELTHLLRITENDMESMRKDHLSYANIQNRVDELERVIGDRDRELDLLRSENASLTRKLTSSEKDLKLLRVEKVSQTDQSDRIRDLERMLAERNGDSRESRTVRVERSGHDDLYERIRDLERLVGERDRPRETRAYRNYDRSEYRFTLEDGSVTYLKGHETIDYEGDTYRAEDLYYLLRDRGMG